MITAASRLSLFRLPVICLLLTFGLTGCWIPASDENPETPVSMNLPTSTFTPEPTATITPEPTETEIGEVVTEEFDARAAETEEAGLTAVAQFDDITPEDPFFDDFNLGPLPTHEDPVIQAATDILATTTQEALDMTATAESFFLVDTATATPDLFIPTLTPTPDFGSGIATPAPNFGSGQCTHVVRAGDNLFRLSLQYNVPIRDIAVASGVANPDLIIVGQTLTIPNCSGGVPGGGTVGGGGAGGITHVVEQGETLYQLSVRYNVPIRNIQAANGIQNVNLIYFNQRLTIP